ncbi:unnamed protein product, partial [Rotaria socialis]
WQKHVVTVSVRLQKLQGIEQSSKHKDLARIFGNDCVFFNLTQDTTSKISSGRSLAKGQAPLIMHLYNENSSLESQTTSIATYALVIANQAPDKALFNIVERCLPSMSHDLAGLILIYDHFGKHLNDTELTEHTELEKENFKVTEVWSINVFDEYPVVAEYINPLQFTDDQLEMVDSTLALNNTLDRYIN